MSFIMLFSRFWHTKDSFPRNAALRRQLSVESLEQRAMLSTVWPPFARTTQYQTVADAQQTIAPAFTQQARLTAFDGAFSGTADLFGQSVAVDGTTLVVGAPGADNQQGAVYIYTDSGGRLTNITQVAKLTPSDGTSQDAFGISVAISGNTVVVGSLGDDIGTLGLGAVYVFVEPSSGWANMTQTAKLTASDGAASNNFGLSVAISGNTVVAGEAGEDSGGAYVFTEPAAGWIDMTQTAKLAASYGFEAGFGSSVSINGKTVVVGGGSLADVYNEPSSGWANMTQTAELTDSSGMPVTSVSISGNTVVTGLGAGNAVYVFAEPNSGWANMTQTAELTYSDSGASNFQGESYSAVSISGKNVVVGAPGATVGGRSAQGAFYVFTEPSSGWTNMTQTAELTASDGAAGDGFGQSVSISSNTVVAGSPNPNWQGVAYLFSTATPLSIISSAPTSANVGRKYTYQVKTNADGQETNFLLSVAPAGMRISASTGLVTWTPTVFQTGSSTVTVLAMDQFGDVTRQTFRITVSGVFAFSGPRRPYEAGSLINIE